MIERQESFNYGRVMDMRLRPLSEEWLEEIYRLARCERALIELGKRDTELYRKANRLLRFYVFVFRRHNQRRVAGFRRRRWLRRRWLHQQKAPFAGAF